VSLADPPVAGIMPLEALQGLKGVTILDSSRYAPGPYCTLVCAALGADVVKVEPPHRGDPLRAMDPEAFERLNAGKKSLTLDLKSREGRDALLRFAERVDVFVDGFRPGVVERLGIDYPSVAARAPSVIYLSLTGYGQSGPYRDRAGHDVSYMAVSGALGGADVPPPLQVADFAAGGLFGVIGILAALLGKNASGAGCHLDLSMHHGLASLLMLASGAAKDRLSGRYPNYTLYRTRDERRLAVGALEPKFWARFCAVLGRSDLVERIGDPEARELVATLVAERDLAYWTDRFVGIDACVEPVLERDEAARHPQAIHRASGGNHFSLPFGEDAAPKGRAPALGEHTEELLVALGHTSEEVARLRSRRLC
jgi:alpha-methylacyl-CoA racemase